MQTYELTSIDCISADPSTGPFEPWRKLVDDDFGHLMTDDWLWWAARARLYNYYVAAPLCQPTTKHTHTHTQT